MKTNFYKKIARNKYPYIIADIGANHNGDMELAKKMIDELAQIKCNAAKFQSWNKNSLFTKGFYKEKSQFMDETFGTLEQMVENFSISKDDHIALKKYCVWKKITFCSSSFSFTEVDMLDELGVPFFKIASMDLNNINFLKYIARKRKPIILSTGMGTLSEIDNALNAIFQAGNNEVIILHCISIYPPDDSIVNLKNIIMLKDTFGLPVGFSDHTIGTSIPLAAIAMGAKVIEKHFTMNKNLPGWDHTVSANVEEMKLIIVGGRRIIKAQGNYNRTVSDDEYKQRASFRRSAVSKKDLEKGHILASNDIDFKRPGSGIKPDELDYIVGREIKREIKRDEIIDWKDLI